MHRHRTGMCSSAFLAAGLLLCIASISTAQTSQAKPIEISGNWVKHSEESEPTRDKAQSVSSQYLLLQNGAVIETNSPLPSGVTYKEVQISFRYWLNYKGPLDSLELSVMACNESTPANQRLPSYDKKKQWIAFSRVVKDTDKKATDYFDINDPVCQEQFRLKLNYKPQNTSVTFAVKDLKLTYKYEDNTIPTTTTPPPSGGAPASGGAAASGTVVTKTITLTKECTEDMKCQDFNVKKANWYYKNPPEFTSQITSYNVPTSKTDHLTVKVQPKNGQDSCVTVKYWVTEKSKILVNVNGGKSSLELTATKRTEQNAWYTVKICASYFTSTNNTKLELKFTAENPDFSSRENVVAIFVDETLDPHADKLEERKINDYLEYWGRATNPGWHTIPDELWTEDSGKVTLKAQGKNEKGVAYLYSPWLEATDTKMKVHYKIEHHKKLTNLAVDFTLLAEQLPEVSKVRAIDLTSNTTVSAVTFTNVKSGSKYMVMVKVTYDFPTEDADVVFSEFYILDGCKGKECNSKGTCENKKGGDYECVCDKKEIHFGKDCEKVDYCNYKSGLENRTYYGDKGKVKGTAINGEKYCKDAKGTCNRDDQAQVKDESLYQCRCPEMHYWHTKGNTCKQINNCDGVVCGANQVCDVSNSTNPCKCEEKFYQLENNACVEKNLCKNACPGAKCAYRKGQTKCYCDHGYKYESDVESCVAIKDDCNAFQKQLMGCHQTCAKNSSNLYECSCFEGYILDATRKQCRMNFTSAAVCSKYEYHTKDGKCDCIVGFTRTADGKCQNMCESAKTDAGLANVIQQYCGGSSNCKLENDKFSCKCEGVYKNAEDGFCTVRTPCLSQNNCTQLGAVCIPTFEKDKLYECACPTGKKKDKNGKCVDPCKDYDSSSICFFSDSECKTDYSATEGQTKCECRPGLFSTNINEHKLCQIAPYKVKLSFVTKIEMPTLAPQTRSKRSTAQTDKCGADIKGCVKYLRDVDEQFAKAEYKGLKEKAIYFTLVNKLTEAFKGLYQSEFISVAIISHKSLADSSEEVVVSLQLTKNVPITLDGNCVNLVATEMAGFCLLPPSLSIKRSSFKTADLYFCEDQERYCGYGTDCLENKKEGRYTCKCSKGYKEVFAIPLSDYRYETDNAKRYCEPVANCGGQCSADEICVASSGTNYTCECAQNSARGTDRKCKPCSDLISCQNGGTCIILHDKTLTCQCPDSWIGNTCDKRAGLWIAIWVVAVVAGIVLLLVIVLAVVMIKKAKKESHSYNGRGAGNSAYENDDHLQSRF